MGNRSMWIHLEEHLPPSAGARGLQVDEHGSVLGPVVLKCQGIT